MSGLWIAILLTQEAATAVLLGATFGLARVLTVTIYSLILRHRGSYGGPGGAGCMTFRARRLGRLASAAGNAGLGALLLVGSA